MFLEQRGYNLVTANNGATALDLVTEQHFDLVFLDENMPGLTGLETLVHIKNNQPNLQVIMITKSEEESIMEEAIGSKISDYLIKPVNPNQILLSIKKNIDTKRLVSQKTTSKYQQEFRQIGMQLGGRLDRKEWEEIFQKLTYWELELDKSGDTSMQQILDMQKSEANAQFLSLSKTTIRLAHGDKDAPIMSHTLFREYVLHKLKKVSHTFSLLLIIYASTNGKL